MIQFYIYIFFFRFLFSIISLVQSFSCVHLLVRPMDCSTPGLSVHHQLLELAQTRVHRVMMASNHLIFCYPLLFLPSIFPSIRIFFNESALCIRWPVYSSCSISTSNEYSRLISFRIDWFDILAVQGTLRSVLQHHNLKASVFDSQPSLLSDSHIHL